MKILKFGGKSLLNGIPLNNVLNIIESESKIDNVAVVVSAIGSSTDQLLNLYEHAKSGRSFEQQFDDFVNHQNSKEYNINLDETFSELHYLLNSIKGQHVEDLKKKDKILSYGELISAQTISHLLRTRNMNSRHADSREFIRYNEINGHKIIDKELSLKLTQQYFKRVKSGDVTVVTGYIASNQNGDTITMGRNGSNVTASLLADFLNASEVQNWTDVNGIYSASPKYVSNARKIDHLNYQQAHELANFGAKILHPSTITPLIKKEIPLKIYSTYDGTKEGTTIDASGSSKGIKAVTVIEDVVLFTIQSRSIHDRVSIDARIFTALDKRGIGVRLISQASSDRGIGFVVDSELADLAEETLKSEFTEEIHNGDITTIEQNAEMAIIAIIGRHNYALEKAIQGLRRNRIWMHLISNSISGEHISLVIDIKDIKKAVNIVHNQVFGVIKTLNVFALGKGTVGKQFIKQVLDSTDKLKQDRKLKINIIGIADSRKLVFKEQGINKNWLSDLENSNESSSIDRIIELIQSSGLDNVVLVDNTASNIIANKYTDILNAGLDIVASNKIANAAPYEEYQAIRNIVSKRNRNFHYETNVGAGLPIIDTLQLMTKTGDQVTKIRGIFSGSLSYLFNQYSERDESFSEILNEAKNKGFTEPDPREDLNGMDVARKLIILAREIGMTVNLEDIAIENLIPHELISISDLNEFLSNKETLDKYYQRIKKTLKENEVLRYVAELDRNKSELQVSLKKVSKNSPLGNIQNADAIFEIYSETYGDFPIVIQGAGAGAEVTARGVYGDLIRIANNK